MSANRPGAALMSVRRGAVDSAVWGISVVRNEVDIIRTNFLSISAWVSSSSGVECPIQRVLERRPYCSIVV